MPMPQATPASAARPFACDGFVLAGGASSRFGSEKSLALLDGAPLIAHAIRLLSFAASHVRIAGAQTQSLADYATIIPDIAPGSGPLAGVFAALQTATAEWSIFLPVDMPLIPPELLRVLVARASVTRAPVTCLRLNGHIEPFPALVHRSIQPSVSAALATHASCARLWSSLSSLDAPAVESLLAAAQLPRLPIPVSLWWRSANTPGDLAFIEACCTPAFCAPRQIP